MPKLVKVVCNFCKKEFQRRTGAVKEAHSKGRKLYCDRRCAGKDNIKNIPDKHRYGYKDISKYSGNRKDKYSPFRAHLKQAKNHARQKNIEISISLDDIKELWEKQNGICPYTGWKLENSPNTLSRIDISPKRASIDRIDNTKGYIKDNIQFVSLMYNLCKNRFSDKDVQEFTKSVVEVSNGLS